MINRMRSTYLCSIAVSMAALSLVAALVAQTTASPAAPATPVPNWKTYSYPAEGFSASFPGEPQFSKRDVPTDKGSFELRAYLVEEGQAALFVGVCDYGTAISDRTPDQVLDGAQQGAIDNVKGHLVSGKKITLGVYPGREFEAESDTMHFSARIYLVGTTLYQTLIAASIAQPYAGVTRFLDSFQLIARVKN
ncbi:MAG: hypothetical protein ACLQGT_09420 [Terracidiphilus sp.]